MLQFVQEIVGYFKHMDELDNLDRLESENVEIYFLIQSSGAPSWILQKNFIQYNVTNAKQR